MNISESIQAIHSEIPKGVTLVCVSKTRSTQEIMEAYQSGQRVFGENKVQEMIEKHESLPRDISWHMIGHLQRNKAKYIAPFVDLIHSVDSWRLLREIEKQAGAQQRKIPCLLQIKIAEEESKFGIEVGEAKKILDSEEYRQMQHVQITGLMGMATLTQEEEKIRKEFRFLKTTFDDFRKSNPSLEILSMGMSGDYRLALESGSNMIRLGTSIFGERKYK